MASSDSVDALTELGCRIYINTGAQSIYNERASLKWGILRPYVFRDRNHRINYCEFSLSRDIETNPRSSVIDPSKTFVAPYSQGNIVDLFGYNGRRKCVAMSLSPLAFNDTNFICLSESLIENNLYSTLSQSSETALLLQIYLEWSGYLKFNIICNKVNVMWVFVWKLLFIEGFAYLHWRRLLNLCWDRITIPLFWQLAVVL